MTHPHHQFVQAGFDLAATGAIVGVLTGLLPPLAAVVAIIWYVIEIWESHTVQRWFRLHRARLRRQRIADRLKAHHDPRHLLEGPSSV